MFNFSNIQLEQWIHFPCNPFFIQPAIMTFLSSFNQPKQKPSISKLQLWLLDTFNTKKYSQVVWFYLLVSIFQRLHFYFILNCLAIYFQHVIPLMECQYSTFHETSNRDDNRTVQWNSSGPSFHLKIDAIFYSCIISFILRYVSLAMRL